MKYSKLLSLLAASTIVASLFAGCQKTEQPVEEPKVEQKEEKTRTIGKESKNSIELVNKLDVDIESICISYGEDGEVSENLLLDEPIKADETVTLFYEGGSGDINITFIPKGDEKQYTVTLEKTEEIKSPVVIKKGDDNKVIVSVENTETKEETMLDVTSKPVEKEEVKEEKKEDTKKEETPKTETKKEETPKTEIKKEELKPSTNNNNSSSNNSSNNGGGNSNTSKPTETHVHNYNIPITQTVHHEAVTETVESSEPVYGWIPRVICNGCGLEFSSTSDFYNHAKTEMMNGNGMCGSYHTDPYQGIIGYEPVYNTVVVNPAYDETVITGYKCSCGAVQ